MIKFIKRWFYTKYYQFVYRKIDSDVCCCGSSGSHSFENHAYVCAKEYHINQCVEDKLK